MSPNLKAFLDMLAWSEGTARVPNSDNGYRVIVGGGVFTGYADHPRKVVQLNATLKSSAAGRYQLLARYFDAYKKMLKLADFSPASQDAIAVQQLKERGALTFIERGEIRAAINCCKNIWASLPGAGYGQHEQSLDKLITAYTTAGGRLA